MQAGQGDDQLSLTADFESMVERIKAHPEGAKFFDPTRPWFQEGDFHCAMDLNRFKFCLRVVPGTPLTIVRCDR